MNDINVAFNLFDLDKISNSLYFLSNNKYYFNNSFDWKNKKYNCVLLFDKKPACGIITKDFEIVKKWEDRKKKNILENQKTLT